MVSEKKNFMLTKLFVFPHCNSNLQFCEAIVKKIVKTMKLHFVGVQHHLKIGETKNIEIHKKITTWILSLYRIVKYDAIYVQQ